VPALIADLGDEAAWRYVEFFTANIHNPNTRRAYARACARFFAWCDDRGLPPATIRPHDVATYIEQLQNEVSSPSVKQQLAAIRMLFDWLVTAKSCRPTQRMRCAGPSGLSTETIVPLIKIPFPIIIWSAIGSLGAMLYRFNNSADAELADPLRWSFTRPLTGILMGIIAYMTFKIGLLVLQPGTIPGRTPGVVPSTSEELLWLAAFLAGFSDRFADSVLRSLTGRLGGDRSYRRILVTA
jgi:Phage integrase, N-terminal SAM-like domain